MSGRPRLDHPVIQVHVHLRLHEGQDDDLISLFRNVPEGNFSTFLKSALRNGAGHLTNTAGLPDDSSLTEHLDDFLR